jgi:hypothetical protein
MDLVVYPPVQTGAHTTAYVANFLILSETARGSGEWAYRPASVVAETPFVFGREVPGVTAAPDETILAFLERIQADHPNVKYRYAWEREPWAVYTIWTGGSVLVMGLVWPSLISLAAGRGLGLKPYRPDEPAYDLERFAGGDEPAKPAAKEMTEEDAQQLAAAEAALRKGLGPAGAAAAPATDGSTDQAIKKLEGKPLEPLAIPGQDEEPKEYKGEYYPVAKPKAHPTEHH